MDVLEWLLNSEAAIRWQAMRDLTDAPAEALAAERVAVAHEGIAATILQSQHPDGSWRGENAPAWLTTLFTMQLLRSTGNEYLLQRLLQRRLSTGEVANPEFLQFTFPPRYHYDVLRALDYFRAGGTVPDPRMREAVDIVQRKRLPDGRWPLDATYDESLAVRLDEAVGLPSRWNTLRALRVLRWCEPL